MMRSIVASIVALALTTAPCVAHAGEWTIEQQEAIDKILELRRTGQLNEAVELAKVEFDRQGADKGYRRAVAREGRVAAEDLYQRDRSKPGQADAAAAALCVAVEFMRVYAGELIESSADRLKIPPQLARLEALTTQAKAPCVRTPDLREKQTTGASPTPAPSPAMLESPPPHHGPRTQVAVGSGLVVLGAGLLAGMSGVLVARRGYDDKIAALDDRATAENRPLTEEERASVDAWDASYSRLENSGKALGVVAGISILAAVVVFALPQRHKAREARVQPVVAGIRIAF